MIYFKKLTNTNYYYNVYVKYLYSLMFKYVLQNKWKNALSEFMYSNNIYSTKNLDNKLMFTTI
jgi:hypothetical protein